MILTPTRKINVMRKQFIHSVILLAIAGWVFGACTNQPLPGSEPADEPVIVEPETVDGMVLTATQPDGDATKTTLSSLGNQKYETLWKTGDQISINGTKSVAVASADNGKKSVDFTVNGTLNSPYNVLYPGTTSANVITLPATQSYVADSFDGTAAASYGIATLGANNKWSVKFHSFCGILRFALKGSATLSRIEVKSLGSEKLYGNFTISNFTTGAFTGGTAGTLTYNIGGVALSNSDTYFYVAIPAQAYASGLEAVVYQSDGAFMTLKFWANDGSGYTLERDTVYEFGSKTYAAGRTENLFGVSDLAAENGGAPTLTPPTITVATFNTMRMDDSDRPTAATTGDNNGKIARPANAIAKTNTNMKVALGLAIYNMAADVIGFQEIGEDSYNTSGSYSIQNMATAQGVSGYTWDLNWKSGSSSYKYCNGFAYKSSVLTLESSGKAWLKTNSNSYSTSSDSNAGDPNRTVVWCLFTHISSGKQFYFFTTQLPPESQNGGSGTSTNYMAGGVNAFAGSKNNTLPKILVGDMNCSAHNVAAAYSTLTSYWTDAWDYMCSVHNAAGDLADWYYYKNPGTQSGTGATYQYSVAQFTKARPNREERRLDHIMVHNGSSGRAVVQSYRTIRNTYEVTDGDDTILCCPSDHLPIVCEITLE